MTITNWIKILYRKIIQYEEEYDLDRKAAKISALSSNGLDKYEYLSGEDLGLKPSTIEQPKFEYSPLDKDDQKEGLFKRLQNIKDKNEQQLQAIKDQGQKQLKELIKISKKSEEANKILLDIKKIDAKLDTAELFCTKTDGTKYHFNTFALPLKFVEKIHNYEITLDETIKNQTKFKTLINKLNNDYNPRT